MGFLSNKIERSEIKPGDHIYAYRAVFAYSHHGIFVGGNKVVHFTCDPDNTSTGFTSFSSYESICQTPSSCTYADCGFRQQPGSGVVISCLDCFLKGSGSPYLFEYGVNMAKFCSKVRGGSCTTAMSDEPNTVIHRAMFLLHNGFGNYNVFENNCEDFALYCKTGLLIDDKKVGRGKSGQVLSFDAVWIAALVSYPLKFVMPNPLNAAVSAAVYCLGRYASDIGVRKDVVKVSVEDLALKWCSMNDLKQDFQETWVGLVFGCKDYAIASLVIVINSRFLNDLVLKIMLVQVFVR